MRSSQIVGINAWLLLLEYYTKSLILSFYEYTINIHMCLLCCTVLALAVKGEWEVI